MSEVSGHIERFSTPRWVWGLVSVLTALPLAHAAWLAYAPPHGYAPTGITIPDSALFLHAMDMFPSGFHSAYATCRAGLGDASFTYYSVPHLWLYGVIGLVDAVLPVGAYLVYAAANALGYGALLLAAWWFFRTACPERAGWAFVLFALSGGLGSLIYLAGRLFLDANGPAWQSLHYWVLYDLYEGPHFNPFLYHGRCYYTLSLAGGLVGLTALWRSMESRRMAPLLWVLPLVAAGAFVNLRFGLFLWAAGVLLLAWRADWPWLARLRGGMMHTAGLAAGAAPALWLMRQNPASVENHQVVGNMAMWLSPFVLAALPHLLLAAPALFRESACKHPFWRLAFGGALGYLAAYALLAAGFKFYHGSLLSARDGALATHVSDAALAGALAGGLWGWLRHGNAARQDGGYLGLWFLLFCAAALSAWGQGWFLSFGPQRLQVVLWIPLCALAALPLGKPAALLRGMAVALGMLGMAVSALAFQGPLAPAPCLAGGPITAHAEVMREEEIVLLESLGAGTVWAPTPAADVVVLRMGNPVVHGIGSFNLTDVPYQESAAATARFFAPETADSDCRAMARDWCVDYVYCPASWPLPLEVLARFDAAPWLHCLARSGGGAVYRVTDSE